MSGTEFLEEYEEEYMMTMSQDTGYEEDTTSFILEVEKRECLWNSSLADYHNRIKVKKAWDEMAALFKKTPDVRRRWKSIRGSYVRAKQPMPSGSATKRNRMYKYAQTLSFLDRVVTPRQTTSTPNTPVCSGSDVSQTTQENLIEENEINNINKQVTNIVNAINNIPQQKEENDYFGLFVAEKLKQMGKQERMSAELEIMQVLQKYS